jgi:hypothetical protein
MDSTRDFQSLQGKHILLISVQFFGYEKRIIEQLQTFGAQVTYFDERPSNSNFTKGIIRLRRNLYQKKIDRHYKNILSQTQHYKIDFLFVIRGEVVPKFFIEAFKEKHTSCHLIFYTWDSFRNHDNAVQLLPYFDRIFTFDYADALRYTIGFRPLFYLTEYEMPPNNSSKLKYDLLFIGTAHSDRYKISNFVMNWCTVNQLNTYFYYFIQSRLLYTYRRLFEPGFEKMNKTQLFYSSIKTDQIINLYKESKVILDIQHPNQKGLTMRIFEALGASKKIITTNEDIINYYFYNDKNVKIIDRDNIVLDKSFFDEEYIPISKEQKKHFTLSDWIYDIFINETPVVWRKD